MYNNIFVLTYEVTYSDITDYFKKVKNHDLHH